ncbi:MAG TPA: hypothetical protein VF713_12885 [Thermoanaerobaculia bacterium]
MRIIRTVLVFMLFGATAMAQSLSMGNALGSTNSGDNNIAATRTDIDLVNPANASGHVTSVRFRWSQYPCPGAAKIKFFRRSGSNLTFVGEVGPFSTTSGDNTFAITPSAFVIQQGDLVGITRLTTCGNPAALSGIVTAGNLSFAGDLTGTVAFSSGVRRGEVIGVSASGTATEVLAAVLPAVGSTAGGFGAHFKTSLQLANCYPGGYTYTGRLVLRKQGVPGSESDPSIPFTLAANSAVATEDLLALFNYTGLGSIDVVVPWGKATPAMVTRVFNDAGSAGTSGFTEMPLDPSDNYSTGSMVPAMGATAVLMTPIDPVHTRFNIGVRTLFSGASITATLRNQDGTVVTSVTKSYMPNYFEQVSAESFLGGVTIGSNQMIVLTVNDGSAIIYGSTTDNVTNDPSVQFAIVVYAIA